MHKFSDLKHDFFSLANMSHFVDECQMLTVDEDCLNTLALPPLAAPEIAHCFQKDSEMVTLHETFVYVPFNKL